MPAQPQFIPQTSHSELALRGLLKRLLPGASPVYNHRPRWLRGCELDIHYIPEKLAFEFDGRQHRQFTPEFHRTESDFAKQQERDGFKREECWNRGIVVVTVQFNDLTHEAVLRKIEDAYLVKAQAAEPKEVASPPKRGHSLSSGLRGLSRKQTQQTEW